MKDLRWRRHREVRYDGKVDIDGNVAILVGDLEEDLFLVVGGAGPELQDGRVRKLHCGADAPGLQVRDERVTLVVLEVEDGRVVELLKIHLTILVADGVLTSPNLVLLADLRATPKQNRYLGITFDDTILGEAVHDPLGLLLSQLAWCLQLPHILGGVVVPLLDLHLELLLSGCVVHQVRLDVLRLAVVRRPKIKLCGLGAILVDQEARELNRRGIYVDVLLQRVAIGIHLNQTPEYARLLGFVVDRHSELLRWLQGEASWLHSEIG